MRAGIHSGFFVQSLNLFSLDMAYIPTPANTSPIPVLADQDYIRQRVDPRFRDLNYLHLKDLAQLLRRVASGTHGEIFDYGCGGAPYRHLFAHCKRYIAADINPGSTVDRVLMADGTTGEAEGSYDAVLSTQVLEHVGDPVGYLEECRRILRSGGELFLTTHGMFEEHGCPYDFHRWTSRGLEELVQKSGLKVVESFKLTTELRGFVQLMNQMVLHFRAPNKPILHFFLAALRKTYCALGVPCLNRFAEFFADQAVLPANNPASLYVCVYVRAAKI